MLIGINGGSGLSNLRLLKNLNQLGVVLLTIQLDGKDLKGVADDAREAELCNKLHIEKLYLVFEDDMYEKEESSRMNVIDALAPHPNLRELGIFRYKGSNLPLWIVSSLNKLTNVCFGSIYNLTSLPSLGKLQSLKEIDLDDMAALESVGREFLGITTNTNFVAFPKLKKLIFSRCRKWKEWEDITAEKEESAAVQIMPCLEELIIDDCSALTILPHFILRKVPFLKTLELRDSKKLQQRYKY